jgi:hypothetical protein
LEALDLFDSHAFKGDASQKGHFSPMKEEIVKACCGLPLSLKVHFFMMNLFEKNGKMY